MDGHLRHDAPVRANSRCIPAENGARMAISAPTLTPVRPPRASTLRDVIEHGLAAHPLGAHTSVSVMDAATGADLVSIRADRLIPPASNEKLRTAIGVLDVFGPEHRFATSVAARGTVDDAGTLDGDLVLVGGGDPSLNSADLRSLARRVADFGVTRVAGNMVVDATAFDDQRWVDSWPTRYRLRDVRALGALAVSQDIDGDRVPSKQIPNPEIHAGQVFREALDEVGVVVDGELITARQPTSGTTIAAHRSAPLSDIVSYMLHRSSSYVAETLTKDLGLAAAGLGTTAAGVAALRDHLQQRGVPIDGSVMLDGSGLAPATRATTRQLAGTLVAGARDARFGAQFVQALATPGTPGTLRNRLLDPDVAPRIHAKTGTMPDAIVLSALLAPPDAPSTPALAVSIVVHDPAGVSRSAARPFVDQLLADITRWEPAPQS